MDWAVGEVLNALDQLGLEKDTFVYFSSDHGGNPQLVDVDGKPAGGYNGIFKGKYGSRNQCGSHFLHVVAETKWPPFSDIFKCNFLDVNVWITIKLSLKFVSKGPIQATSHCLNQWWLVYWRIYASLGLNDLKAGNHEIGYHMIVSLWNLASASVALLKNCLSDFRAIRRLKIYISCSGISRHYNDVIMSAVAS